MGIMNGFFGGEGNETMRAKCQAAKEEWKKHSHEWKKSWNCPYKREQEKKEEEKVEKKEEEKKEKKTEVDKKV
jgi:hypothetical protein